MKAGDWVVLNRDMPNWGYEEGALGQVQPNSKSEGETTVKRIMMDSGEGWTIIAHPSDVTIIDPNVADIMRMAK